MIRYLTCLFFVVSCCSVANINNEPINNLTAFKSAVSPDFPNGLHYKLLQHISKKLNQPVDIQYAPFARRLNLLNNGQIDLVVGIRKTPEREKKYIFINPGYSIASGGSGLYTLTKKFTTDRTTDKAIDNKTTRLIAVTTGSLYLADYKLPYPYKKIEVASLEQCIKLLLRGRIHGFVHSKVAANRTLNLMSLTHKISLTERSVKNKGQVVNYIAIAKTSMLANKVEQLKQIAQELRQGEYQKIYQQHYQPK